MSAIIYSRARAVNTWNMYRFRSLITSAIPQEQKIKVGIYDINYTKVGRGPHHLLFFPGTFGTIWTDFKPQIEGFDKNKFTLVIWDAPGQGKSRPPEKIFDFNFFERDTDYAYQFMKALQIETYSVLGWSAGGTVAMIHAAKYSDIVRKLVVWGSCSFLGVRELETVKKMRHLSNWSKDYLEGLIGSYGEENLSKLMSKWSDLLSEIYNTRSGNLCMDFLPNIKCPTYILHGKNDPATDKKHVSHLLANIAGSRFYIYPDGKHNIHIKKAEDFNKRVQEFLLE